MIEINEGKKWLSDILEYLNMDDENMISNEKSLEDMNKKSMSKIREMNACLIEQIKLNEDMKVDSICGVSKDNLLHQQEEIAGLKRDLSEKINHWRYLINNKNKNEKLISDLYNELMKANDFLLTFSNNQAWSLEVAEDNMEKLDNYKAALNKTDELVNNLNSSSNSQDEATIKSNNKLIAEWQEMILEFDTIYAEKNTELENWQAFTDRRNHLEAALGQVFKSAIEKLEKSPGEINMVDLKPVLDQFEDINHKCNILEKLMNELCPENYDSDFIEVKNKVDKANKAIQNLHEKYKRQELAASLEHDIDQIYEKLNSKHKNSSSGHDNTVDSHTEIHQLKEDLDQLTIKARKFYTDKYMIMPKALASKITDCNSILNEKMVDITAKKLAAERNLARLRIFY